MKVPNPTRSIGWLPLIVWLSTLSSPAGTFTNLHVFGGYDGSDPESALVASGGLLYGTTVSGGSGRGGIVFSIGQDGSNFTQVHGFSVNDGYNLQYGAVLPAGGVLYGVAPYGGSGRGGVLFAVGTNGTAFTNLISFTTTGTPNPYGGLVLSGTTLFGTTTGIGLGTTGTVFEVDIDGAGFNVLHTFPTPGNRDPFGGLLLDGTTLYGTLRDTGTTGTGGSGAVFAMDISGSNYTTLHQFSALSSNTNADGAGPFSTLVLSGGKLFGTTSGGGAFGNGGIFMVNTNGTGFTNLYSFSALNYDSDLGIGTNSDGANPCSSLVLSGGTLFGVALYGGAGGSGTIFAINTGGTGVTNLHSFGPLFYSGETFGNTNADGANPIGGLATSGNTLFGTTANGGDFGSGTVFALTLDTAPAPIPLVVSQSPAALVFSWSDPRFALQSSSSLGDVFTNIPGATSPYTNKISGPRGFFRLRMQ